MIYVDDIVRVKEKIKDLGSLRYFFDMEVARSKKGVVVSQNKYILDHLKETRKSGCRPADTPIMQNFWINGMFL